MSVSFVRGYCRECGANVAATDAEHAITHAPLDYGVRVCPGSGEPIADDARLMFWRVTRSEHDTWIVVSRGVDHARDLFQSETPVEFHLLDDDEIVTVQIDRVLIGSVQWIEGVRLWRVGTIATEVRR